ncbi:MAG: FAD-dependent oxidoreductase [Agriterribacter sp.]
MIKRDGERISIWQNEPRQYRTKHINAIEKHFDVVIAGGGITGISTALQLQLAGKKCLVLEAENIGFGTTGGTTAHLNTLLDTPYTTISKNFGEENAALVAQAAGEALQLIQNNIDRFGISCGFEHADAYLFAQDEKQQKELEDIIEASKKAGLDMDTGSTIPVPVDFVAAARATGQAKFNPIDYLYGIAEAFEAAGGVIVQHTRVQEVKDAEPLEILTNTTSFTANDLIYATHIPPGVNLLHLRCAPYRSYAMAVTLKNDDYPSDLAYDMQDPYHYYRTQVVNGQPYLIAGGKDHKTGHEPNTLRSFQELESHVRKYFAVADVAYRWSSQYYEPADGLPYIGHLPGHPEHLYVATGFGGNGMTYSHVSAQLLTSLILQQSSKYEKLFDPNRLKPVAGFVGFLQHNLDVAKQYINRLMPAEKLTELADIAPGEGRVVKFEDQRIAVYKNDKGTLHAIDPVCTHLKCEVSWNAAESSWDCPCHGARYGIDGNVLTGPADKQLDKIELTTE